MEIKDKPPVDFYRYLFIAFLGAFEKAGGRFNQLVTISNSTVCKHSVQNQVF